MAEDIKAFGKEIFALIDRRRDELFELLSDLIHINSENFRNYGNERTLPWSLTALLSIRISSPGARLRSVST